MFRPLSRGDEKRPKQMSSKSRSPGAARDTDSATLKASEQTQTESEPPTGGRAKTRTGGKMTPGF